jgi:hypothetical protein
MVNSGQLGRRAISGWHLRGRGAVAQSPAHAGTFPPQRR